MNNFAFLQSEFIQARTDQNWAKEHKQNSGMNDKNWMQELTVMSAEYCKSGFLAAKSPMKIVLADQAC